VCKRSCVAYSGKLYKTMCINSPSLAICKWQIQICVFAAAQLNSVQASLYNMLLL